MVCLSILEVKLIKGEFVKYVSGSYKAQVLSNLRFEDLKLYFCRRLFSRSVRWASLLAMVCNERHRQCP